MSSDEINLEELNYRSSEMLTGTDKKKATLAVIKSLLRYPFNCFRKNSSFDNDANVYFSYSDHPLDVNGTAFNSPFTYLKKHRGRRAQSVLRIALRRRDNNCFVFDARGYDIYKVIDLDASGVQHNYLVDDKTQYAHLTRDRRAFAQGRDGGTDHSARELDPVRSCLVSGPTSAVRREVWRLG